MRRIRVHPGQYYDQEIGLHYNYHRYYDPRSGRYLRTDPSHSVQPDGFGIPYLFPELLNTPEELNGFSYVNNSPVRLIDPYGLIGWDTVIRTLVKQAAKYLLKKGLGEDSLERGAEHERQWLKERYLQEFERCLEDCKKHKLCNQDHVGCEERCAEQYRIKVEALK